MSLLALLRRFQRLTVVEPDPLARLLLQRRLDVELETERRDLLVAPLLSGRVGLESFHDRWSLDAAAVTPLPSLSFAEQPSDEQLGLAWVRSARRRTARSRSRPDSE